MLICTFRSFLAGGLLSQRSEQDCIRSKVRTLLTKQVRLQWLKQIGQHLPSLWRRPALGPSGRPT